VKRNSELGTTITANVVPSSLILFSLMREALCFSETLFLTKATQLYIPEAGILQSHRREILKSSTALICWAL
jgi:hypothetical protein